MKSSALVIPTLNEEASIGSLLKAITENSRLSHIIIIDDASTDGTRGKIKEFANNDHRIICIERSGPRSFAESYRDGFLHAIKLGADQVIQMDADGSHPSESLNDILDMLEKYDMVIGSRFLPNSKTSGRGIIRRGISKLGNTFARTTLKSDISDMTGGFNGWRTAALRELLASKFPYQGFIIQVWLKWQVSKKYTWQEIPIHFRERTQGSSKFTARIFSEGTLGILKMRFGRFNESPESCFVQKP